MKKYTLFLRLCFFGFFLSGFSQTRAVPQVDLIEINDAITPVTSRFIKESIEEAIEDSAECLIIMMDTPGGLVQATQVIVKHILSSEVPVVVYVAPSGSGAVSAGVSITLAAHIAVMASGTNIGAAHPVTPGPQDTSDVKMEKYTNWWATFNRSIAEKRGRNPDWAEDAVRKSVSITEKEALEIGVVDMVCENLRELLDRIDGKEVEVLAGKKILKTKEAVIKRLEMGLRYRILSVISNPNIAYILLMLGIYGLFFELSNPGSIFPGVVGAIFLILAFFALQTLPINYAGLLLILLGIVLFIAEIKITSYGMLTVGGVISMILGSIMLFESPEPFFKVSLGVILPAVIFTALFFIFALSMALRAHKRQVSTGTEGLVGEIGEARTNVFKDGSVSVHGEIWNATSARTIKAGTKVRVIGVDRMTLRVERFKEG
ncbi:nodulation protein NfeD [candidate division KSB1 bacterium]|nr:nodulation protein NfeD [candidate division KSB1 bacterium]